MYPVLYNTLKKAKYKFFHLIESDKKNYERLLFKRTGIKINWEKPLTFSEKIQWRKLNQKNDLFSLCSDKYLVRDYVREKSKCNLIPLFSAYDKWQEIDFTTIKTPFVIKTNHGSGGVVFIRDLSDFCEEKARKEIEMSLGCDYGLVSRERHYSKIKPKILIEEMLTSDDGKLPFDIKVHCFNGSPKFIQVANSDHTENNIYDINWNFINVSYLNNPSTIHHKRPSQLDDILSISRDLSKDFDYVRVDLYEIKGEIYFGELTFTPNNGMAIIEPHQYNLDWGSFWELNK